MSDRLDLYSTFLLNQLISPHSLSPQSFTFPFSDFLLVHLSLNYYFTIPVLRKSPVHLRSAIICLLHAHHPMSLLLR